MPVIGLQYDQSIPGCNCLYYTNYKNIEHGKKLKSCETLQSLVHLVGANIAPQSKKMFVACSGVGC